jgi:hypothetical protein
VREDGVRIHRCDAVAEREGRSRWEGRCGEAQERRFGAARDPLYSDYRPHLYSAALTVLAAGWPMHLETPSGRALLCRSTCSFTHLHNRTALQSSCTTHSPHTASANSLAAPAARTMADLAQWRAAATRRIFQVTLSVRMRAEAAEAAQRGANSCVRL